MKNLDIGGGGGTPRGVGGMSSGASMPADAPDAQQIRPLHRGQLRFEATKKGNADLKYGEPAGKGIFRKDESFSESFSPSLI